MAESVLSSNKDHQSGNGPKALVFIISIIAVIAGIYSMVEPMQQRIDFLERQVAHQDVQINALRADQATMQQRFKEIETQFCWMGDIQNVRANNTEKWVALLWKQVTGMDLPATDYWPLRGKDKE